MIYVKNNAITGVIIFPGIEVSIKALVGNAALLPDIDIKVPKKVLGKNTIECMQSGVTYGVAAQIDGLVEMIKKEVNEEFSVITTGGLSGVDRKSTRLNSSHVRISYAVFCLKKKKKKK